MAKELRIRRTARIIVLNDYEEILLIKHVDTTPANPKNPEILSYWVAPGGGVEDGEGFEEAAIRELFEETGIAIDKCEQHIYSWNGELIFAGELVNQVEQFFLLRAPGRPTIFYFDASEGIVDARWWPISEIETSSEIFFPTGLVKLMRDILGS